MAESSEDSMTKQEDIENLLDHFSRNSYSAKGDVTGMLALNTCLELFGKDYMYTIINNGMGQLCGHYPSKLVVLDYESPLGCTPADNRYQPLTDRRRVEELMRQSRVARCRTRFVAPVILYKGKHICRSATLAGWQELFGRKGMDMVLSGGMTNGRTTYEEIQPSAMASTSGSQQVFDRHRGKDIQLLEELDVNYICDLMVEMKKSKYGFNITSSEKVDKENRYKNFRVLALPYPGCEFFSNWKDSGYDSRNVYYDWSQELNTSLLDLQKDPILTSLHIPWETYKDWDLVTLTQNYMKALLQLLEQGTSGVLVHCISGWDRTPLFISLLRLSLWADGAVHKSLPASDILYLTLAYDWYLFGHGLPDRLSKGQEILYFCFKMLNYISGPEFSVYPENNERHTRHNSPHTRQQSSPPHNDCSGLRHEGSNVSLVSMGSDGMPFVLDTTQDEDSISPLGWDAAPSPQRSRHPSGSSTDEHRGRRNSLRRGSFGTDPPLHYDTPPDQHRRLSYSSAKRGQSPEVCGVSDSHSHRHCRTGLSEEPLIESSVSNHLSSSPVNVPPRQSQHPDHVESLSKTPSLGSWVDVGFPQMTPPCMITPPKHPPGFDNHSSIHLCQEASDHNTVNRRRGRLNAVAQMFEDAYFKAVLSKPSGGQGALSSLIGNMAEKMGFRSGPR